MNESPIEQLLRAFDAFDLDGAMSLMAPGCRFTTADGRNGEGTDGVRSLLEELIGALRSASHLITSEWHQGDTWIAEMEATYVLQDWLRLSNLHRAFFVRGAPGAIEDVRVYGSHERPLTEHRTGEEGMWIQDHWIPPL